MRARASISRNILVIMLLWIVTAVSIYKPHQQHQDFLSANTLLLPEGFARSIHAMLLIDVSSPKIRLIDLHFNGAFQSFKYHHQQESSA